jgi:hypothetical protein
MSVIGDQEPSACRRQSPELLSFTTARHVRDGILSGEVRQQRRLIFASYDPAVHFGSEQSCEGVLPGLALLASERFDFCVIDGNHDAGYLQRELDHIHCLLTPKAIVVLDDISWQWPDLEAAWSSLDGARWRKVTADGCIGILQRN